MIEHISIRNFAIIENTEFDPEPGLNAVTGETGAGKSIVVEAISLALGSRADSSYVRHGEEKAYVELLADIDGEEYVISRELSVSGKNICRINGRLSTLSEVQELSHRIADIHGQYDNQLLLDPDNHLSILDSYGEKDIAPVKAKYEDSYNHYKEIKCRYDKLLENARENEKKKDFYEYQIAEIDGIAPVKDEDRELTDKISILENSEKIYSAVNSARAALDEREGSILEELGEISSSLSAVKGYSERLSKLSASFDESYFALQDSAKEMLSLSDMADFSPEDLDKAIKRLDDIDGLKSKYGETIDDVLAYRDKISEDLLSINNFDSDKEELEAELSEARQVLKADAFDLTAVRKDAAKELAGGIAQELKELNFNESEIEINIRPADVISRTGADQCEIMISTNRGEPLKPLVKVASGGEVSRIMLAIKNTLGDNGGIPTMIFDEIDSGISGVTASAVARKLRKISEGHQIICITHLPQIAAASEHNYRIQKSSDDERTYTAIEKLGDDEKIDEISRLLAGDSITDTVKESARELIEAYK